MNGNEPALSAGNSIDNSPMLSIPGKMPATSFIEARNFMNGQKHKAVDFVGKLEAWVFWTNQVQIYHDGVKLLSYSPEGLTIVSGFGFLYRRVLLNRFLEVLPNNIKLVSDGRWYNFTSDIDYVYAGYVYRINYDGTIVKFRGTP